MAGTSHVSRGMVVERDSMRTYKREVFHLATNPKPFNGGVRKQTFEQGLVSLERPHRAGRQDQTSQGRAMWPKRFPKGGDTELAVHRFEDVLYAEGDEN